MAKRAKEDSDYQYIIESIKSKIKTTEINENSELKKMEGDMKFLSVNQTKQGEIVVRNNSEILIPLIFRKKSHNGTPYVALI